MSGPVGCHNDDAALFLVRVQCVTQLLPQRLTAAHMLQAVDRQKLAAAGCENLSVLDGGSIGRDELPALLEKYRDLFLQAEVTTFEELEDKIIRRLVQLGFAEDSNGIYRFLPPMHRFLDVCLSVQQDRDLAASLHSTLPLPTPVLIEEESPEELNRTDDPLDLSPFEESEEDALARAIAEEQQEIDA